MLQFTVIGNLGANAEVKNANGKNFISFQVSSNDSWTDEAGTKHESVDWISCAMSYERGEKLLPFLTMGKKVYVTGRGSFRCYSSEKARGFVGAGNIAVERLELLSSQSDEVPRELFERDGILHQVFKAYYIRENEASAICGSQETAELISKKNEKYIVQKAGWVTKKQEETNSGQQSAQQQQQKQQQQDEIF